MAVSRESAPDDRCLVRYLLGQLPEEEAERLDEQSIVDDDVAARLRAVENDLVDAYVAGTLDRDVRERFESSYLASPRRREKVQFARRLSGAIGRSAAQGTSRPQAAALVAEPIRRLLKPAGTGESAASRSRFAWPIAASAAAVLVLACGILLFQDVRLRRGLIEARQQQAAAADRARALGQQLEGQRAETATMSKALDRARAVQPTAAFALVLLPQTRGVGLVPVVAVRSGTSAVPIELQLEAADFDRYQVALKDPGTGRTVWQSGLLAADASRRPPTISLSVPVSIVKAQHYSLELAGRHRAGTFENAGSYTFQIQAR